MSGPGFREFEVVIDGRPMRAKVRADQVTTWMRQMDQQGHKFRTIDAPSDPLVPGVSGAAEPLPSLGTHSVPPKPDAAEPPSPEPAEPDADAPGSGLRVDLTPNPRVGDQLTKPRVGGPSVIPAFERKSSERRAKAKQLREERERAERDKPSLPEAVVRGLAQGFSAKTSDEMAGVGAAAADRDAELMGRPGRVRKKKRAMARNRREEEQSPILQSAYQAERDRYRAKDAAAYKAHDVAAPVAEFAGTVASAFPLGLSGGTRAGAAAGAAVAERAPTLMALLRPSANMLGRMAQSGTAAGLGTAAQVAGGAEELQDIPEELESVGPASVGIGALMPPALAGMSRLVRKPLRAVGEAVSERIRNPAKSPTMADPVRALERVGAEPSVRGSIRPSASMTAEMDEAVAAGSPSAIDHTAGKVATRTVAALETMRARAKQATNEAKERFFASPEGQKLVPPEVIARELGDQKLVDELMPQARMNRETGEFGFDARTLDALRRKYDDLGKSYSGKEEHGQARYFQRAAARIRGLRDQHFPDLGYIDQVASQEATQIEALLGALGIKENSREVVDEIGSQHWRRVFDKLVREDSLPVDEALRRALESDPEAIDMLNTLSALKAHKMLKGSGQPSIGMSVGATGPRPIFGFDGQSMALRAAGLKSIPPVAAPGQYRTYGLPFAGADPLARRLAELRQGQEGQQ